MTEVLTLPIASEPEEITSDITPGQSDKLEALATKVTSDQRDVVELGFDPLRNTSTPEALAARSRRMLEELTRHAVQDLQHQPAQRSGWEMPPAQSA